MKNQASHRHNTRSGSIFFWILVMVFLFGALSFALSQGSRTGSSSLVSDRAKLTASEILDYTGKTRAAIKQMRIGGGCPLNKISFYSASWATPADYDNANSPASGADFLCHIFHPNGGNLRLSPPPEHSAPESEYYFTADTAIQGIGSTAPELLVILRYVDGAVCQEINKFLNVQSFAKDTYKANSPYDGTPPTLLETLGNDNDNPAFIAGKNAACLQAKDAGGDDPQKDGSYFFYYVLEAR